MSGQVLPFRPRSSSTDSAPGRRRRSPAGRVAPTAPTPGDVSRHPAAPSRSEDRTATVLPLVRRPAPPVPTEDLPPCA